MTAHRVARVFKVALATLLLARAMAQSPADPPAPAPPQSEAQPSIAAAVERAEALVAQGNPRDARKVLVEVLRREGPSDALKHHVPAIDALLRETQFALSWREPSRRELPGGDVSKWTESEGEIVLRYTRSTTRLELPMAEILPGLQYLDGLGQMPVVPVLMLPAADHLLAASGVLVHEALFGDEWALEIKGDLPEDECNVTPHVFLCVEEGSHYDLALTWPRYAFSSLSGNLITGRQGGVRRVAKGVVVEDHVDSNPIEKYGMKKRRSYTVVVKLKPAEIFFSINGVAGPRIPRDPKACGRLGYTAFPRVSSIEVSGQKDRAWFDSLAAARQAAARASFDAAPTADRSLPEWWQGLVTDAAPGPDG